MNNNYFSNCLKSAFFILIIVYNITACGVPKEPVNFKAGEHDCHYCKMKISDLRFRGQVVTHKGKIHNFDSIECLKAWSGANMSKINSSWAGDFMQNGKWIDFNKALILKSDKLKSPMGAGLSAYETRELFNKAEAQYNGSLISGEEFNLYINEWKSKIFKKQPRR
ncbi:MAG: nitrous oxide reductase accessory protein NosL [Spirochaetia bacterium]|nr:nitrous oxide reductase accessory protein NosL [Spirochaetia bacterium]